jgi:HAD superfamily hydrolase (TIGR01509 family)
VTGTDEQQRGTNSLRAVVWDMDGTLLDSASVVPDAFIATVQALSGTTYSREQIIELYPLGPPTSMLTRLLGRPCTAADLAAYHRRLRATASRVRPYPDIRRVLEVLRRLLPMAVFTGASNQAACILLGATGLLEHFDVVVAGDQVAHQKPHPDGVIRACEGLGVPARLTAYVADAPIDVESARRAGALPVAAGWGHLHSATAAARVVLDQPRELLGLLGVA